MNVLLENAARGGDVAEGVTSERGTVSSGKVRRRASTLARQNSLWAMPSSSCVKRQAGGVGAGERLRWPRRMKQRWACGRG